MNISHCGKSKDIDRVKRSTVTNEPGAGGKEGKDA
jgi:hypothetical protein